MTFFKFNRSEKKHLLLIILGLMLVLIFFFITRSLVQEYQTIIPNSYEYFQLFYWGGFILVLTPLIFFYSKSSTKIKMISVIVFVALILFSYPLLASYNHIYNRDVLYNYQVASLYLENNHLVYSGATGEAEQYINYPGVPLIHAITSLLTGINLEIVYLFLLPLIRLLILPVIIFITLSQYFSKNLSILGIFLYFSSFSIKTHIHNETLAVIFLFLVIYFYLKEIKFTWLWVSVFSILILLIHHFTFYILVLGGIILVILKTYKQKWAIFIYPLLFLMGLGLIFFIPSLKDSFVFYFNLIIHSIQNMFSNGILADINKLLSMSNGINFNILEILFVLGSIGVLLFLIGYSLKWLQQLKQGRLKEIIILSGVITLITLPLGLTKEYFIPLRIFELTLIGLLPLLLISFERIYHSKKKVILLSLIILFVGGNLLIVGAQQRAFYNDTTVTHVYANSLNQFYSLPEVFKQGVNGYILSDLLIFDIYGGYFNLDINYYPLNLIEEIFFNNSFNPGDVTQLEILNYSYIVIHNYMLEDINDLFGEIMTETAYQKFNEEEKLNKIYNTEIISIYYIK